MAASTNKEVAVFGGGCFWCTEAIFNELKGVTSVLPGYTGGTTEDPTYEEVHTGRTGHAEATKVEFDPSVISYDDLLAVFFNTHDPTSLNRQGNDVGTEYRSAIFYVNDEQKQKAEALIKEINESKAFDKPVVTEVVPFTRFYKAEDYHMKYYESHKDQPYCEIIIAPKLEKLEKKFAELLKSSQA